MKRWVPGRGALGSGSALLVGTVFLLAPFARFWDRHPEYAYGWGVPLLAAYLAWERWRCRPEPRPPAGRSWGFGLVSALAIWALVLLGVRLMLETEPASRPLLWLDASLLVGALLAWIGLLGGLPWLRHFAIPIIFVLAGVPWIFACEFSTTQELMRLNAAAVAATLNGLGVPSHAAGNTIVLATGQLGVTEACSGIRSLQAALMMSLFFGEFYRYGAWGRAALIGVGTGMALAGNFARMLYLAWRGAHEGVAEVEAAHDSTGWLILLITVVTLWLICLGTRPLLQPRVRPLAEPCLPARQAASAWATGMLAAVLLAEAATQGWYGWREQAAPRYPSWSVAWPESAAGFHRTPVPESIRETLRAEDAAASTWHDKAGGRWSGLWIRYGATAEGKVVFESHNPRLCLTAAGWIPAGPGGSFPLRVNGIDLVIERSTFTANRVMVHVFWIPYLNGGVRASADQGPGIYGHSFVALAEGRFPLLADVWAGCRGVQAETLELALVGPTRTEEADSAFHHLIPTLIRPDAPKPPTLAEDSR
jgi:exosortase